jgi:hypothetical protein
MRSTCTHKVRTRLSQASFSPQCAIQHLTFVCLLSLFSAPIPQVYQLGVFLTDAASILSTAATVSTPTVALNDSATSFTANIGMLLLEPHRLPTILLVVVADPATQQTAASVYSFFKQSCLTQIMSSLPASDINVTMIASTDNSRLTGLGLHPTVVQLCASSAVRCFLIDINPYSTGRASGMTIDLEYRYSDDAAAAFAVGDSWKSVRTSSHYSITFLTPYFSRDNSLSGVLFSAGAISPPFVATQSSYGLILSVSRDTDLTMLFSLNSSTASITSTRLIQAAPPSSYVSPLSPAVEENSLSYETTFGHALTPQPTFACGYEYSMSVGAVPFGRSTVTITIRSEVGDSLTWFFSILRLTPQLESIAASAGMQTPTFDGAVLSYMLLVPSVLNSSVITFTYADALADVQVEWRGKQDLSFDSNTTHIVKTVDSVTMYLEQTAVNLSGIPFGDSWLHIQMRCSDARYAAEYVLLIRREILSHYQLTSFQASSPVAALRAIGSDTSHYELAGALGPISFQFIVPDANLTLVATRVSAADGSTTPVSVSIQVDPVTKLLVWVVSEEMTAMQDAGNDQIVLQLLYNSFDETTQQSVQELVGVYTVDLVPCQCHKQPKVLQLRVLFCSSVCLALFSLLDRCASCDDSRFPLAESRNAVSALLICLAGSVLPVYHSSDQGDTFHLQRTVLQVQRRKQYHLQYAAEHRKHPSEYCGICQRVQNAALSRG